MCSFSVMPNGTDGLARQFESDFFAVKALEAFTVNLTEKIFLVGCHVVDEMLAKGFLLGERFGLAHCAFGYLDVAAAPRNHGTHQGGGIVFNLLLHLVVGLDRGWADEQHGVCRAGVGSGGHGGDVGGFEYENSRGTGAAAAGRDVNDDRNLRSRDLLDDLAGGFDEASRCIDLDQYGLVVAARGFVDGAGDIFRGDGLNGVVDDDFEDFGGADGAENEGCREAEKNSRDLRVVHESSGACKNILTPICESRQTFLRFRWR